MYRSASTEITILLRKIATTAMIDCVPHMIPSCWFETKANSDSMLIWKIVLKYFKKFLEKGLLQRLFKYVFRTAAALSVWNKLLVEDFPNGMQLLLFCTKVKEQSETVARKFDSERETTFFEMLMIYNVNDLQIIWNLVSKFVMNCL